MTRLDISNSDDVIDTRNLIEAVEDLENQRDDLYADRDELEQDLQDLEDDDQKQIKQDEIDSLNADIDLIEQDLAPMSEFANQVKEICDYEGGETLVRDSYWQEYVEELVKDIGDLPNDLPAYIESNIDWEGVASDIQQDYSSADFDGVTYWVRSS